MVTHNEKLALQMDRVIKIADGRVEQEEVAPAVCDS
jgi:ABC-type lipoprotein export system ATPase subunit